MKTEEIRRFGNDKIRDMFEVSFDEQVGIPNRMGDCEAKVIQENDTIAIELLVTGMAGSPSVDDFKNDSVEKAKEVVIDFNGEEAKFSFDAEKTIALNINDYLLVYELV